MSRQIQRINTVWGMMRKADYNHEEVKRSVDRKSKKLYFGTRRRLIRANLEIQRKRDRCKHDGTWETKWSPIVGEEWRSEPDYDYCAECGMTEMEIDARNGSKFWQRSYPRKKPNRRERMLVRAINLEWRRKR